MASQRPRHFLDRGHETADIEAVRDVIKRHLTRAAKEIAEVGWSISTLEVAMCEDMGYGCGMAKHLRLETKRARRRPKTDKP